MSGRGFFGIRRDSEEPSFDPFTSVAFCIMSNHFHILMKSEEDHSKIMKLINWRYSDYYLKLYRHVGRIYQRHYYSKQVCHPAALLIVSRYIHRNPVETSR
ncbi:transposase [Sporosarcina gallistercoris]|uniref:transposase n=1 Tax=Sporosarcina gallistercoris TaxID=2762245 RepID=UPI003D2D821A